MNLMASPQDRQASGKQVDLSRFLAPAGQRDRTVAYQVLTDDELDAITGSRNAVKQGSFSGRISLRKPSWATQGVGRSAVLTPPSCLDIGGFCSNEDPMVEQMRNTVRRLHAIKKACDRHGSAQASQTLILRHGDRSAQEAGPIPVIHGPSKNSLLMQLSLESVQNDASVTVPALRLLFQQQSQICRTLLPDDLQDWVQHKVRLERRWKKPAPISCIPKRQTPELLDLNPVWEPSMHKGTAGPVDGALSIKQKIARNESEVPESLIKTVVNRICNSPVQGARGAEDIRWHGLFGAALRANANAPDVLML